jgi:hypothetical protein
MEKQVQLSLWKKSLTEMDSQLDQFYTKQDVAKTCYEFLLRTLKKIGLKSNRAYFVEPSAGTGNFLNLVEGKRKIGIDIDPRGKGIIKQNFFTWSGPNQLRSDVVTFGNPPFGRRSRLAIRFFNKSAEFSDTIAFIVPVQFRKYSVQSKLHTDYKLVAEKLVGQEAFYTTNGKDFHANCVFQVWTKRSTHLKNLRLLKAPPIHHPEFKIYQYNNTKEAEKFFHYPFDFGVPRQGYEDYRRRERDARKMERYKQWALFKATNRRILKRLMNIDFDQLAKTRNTTIPGFGKADVVDEYRRLYA